MARQDTEPARLTESTFTPDRTRVVLETACRLAGIDYISASLLRHHTNAVYVLTDAPIVVKIGRPGWNHIDVVGLVRWLEQRAVPTVRLIEVDQPVLVAGCPVTFWRYLDQRDAIVDAEKLAEPLAALHAQSVRPPVSLPDQQIRNTFTAIGSSIDGSPILSPEDRSLLHARRVELAAQAPEVRYVLAPGVIHGDAHHRNALQDSHGRAVLCDWESAAVGPPEWDLVTLEVHCRRFGHPADEYDRFCRAYGFDIRDWTGYRWLRNVRELRMITTNARKSAPGSNTAAEVLRRIEALHVDAPITWSIL
ncbi:aminoglycoside phosphotransferase family protein [Nocardia uniformis]|uniref:Aminoglycoside phosphotransferase family protein n=1 Tax=Nocardia uniformis TaxID=53432 RepID=A0A849BYU8_9NOCA|nr:aminoglycoside phosphotransferase family protein [Nocardia uniformis]NNH69430.1 aminoglycoside phosphotransferase family protein [Nocardia uniformis]